MGGTYSGMGSDPRVDSTPTINSKKRFLYISLSARSTSPSGNVSGDRETHNTGLSDPSEGLRSGLGHGNFEHVSSPQEGRSHATSDQPYHNQPLRRPHPFQNGGAKDSSRFVEKGLVDGESGSGGCISPRPSPSRTPEIFPVQMERGGIPMASDAIRLLRCSTHLHQVDERGSTGGKSARSSGCDVPRRRSDHGTYTRSDNPCTGLVHAPTIRVWVLDECEQIHSHTNTSDRVPRNPSELSQYDVLSTTRQARKLAGCDTRDAHQGSERKTIDTALATDAMRQITVDHSVRHPHTYAHELSHRDAQICRLESTQVCTPVSTGARGLAMVEGQPSDVEWKAHSKPYADSRDRHRRIGEGMGGSALPTHRREEGMPRLLHKSVDEQQPRASSDPALGSIACALSELVELLGARAHRQSDFDVIHQPHGRPNATPVEGSGADTQVLSSTQHSTDSGVSPRSTECSGGPALPSGGRLVAGTIAPRPVSSSGESVGSPHTGLLRVSDEQPVQAIRESASGSDNPVHRFSISSSIDSREPVGVSPIRSAHTSHAQNRQRESKRDSSDTGMASTALVASVAPPTGRLANVASSPSLGPTDMGGGKAKGSQTKVVVGRSEALRKELRMHGLSPAACNLVFSQYKPTSTGGTLRQHDLLWTKWATWCGESGRDPNSFESAHVLNYVAERIPEQSYNSKRKFISMCSVTNRLMHKDTEGYVDLATCPKIVAALTGLRRVSMDAAESPPPPYFSLTQLFNHLISMSSDDSKCDIQTLRDKCIVLMLIDGIARPSDIATIDREDMSPFLAAGAPLSYSYYYTKERKVVGLQPRTIGRFDANPLICTPTCVTLYYQRTMLEVVTTRERLVNGSTVKRAPLFLASHSGEKEKKIYNGLTVQRISNIAKLCMYNAGIMAFHAKNIRGAAASKCRNLGMINDTICERARWSPRSNTFMQYYFRLCTYRDRDQAPAGGPIELLLRYNAIRQ